MKKLLAIIFFSFNMISIRGQSVGIGTNSPNNSAALEISSNTKGILIPRMTTAQRNTIVSPSTGLLLFDTNSNSFWYFNGTSWTDLSAAVSNDWKTSGNSGTNPGTNFLGTTDNQPVAFKVNNQRHGYLTGNGNVFWGRDAGLFNTSYSNIAIGHHALYYNSDRNGLIAIGDSALMNNGFGAAGGAFARYNTAVGSKALYANNTGYGNTALGFRTLMNNTSGYYNIAIGEMALNSNENGFENIGIGYNALNSNSSGTQNLALGNEALKNSTTGSLNIAIGNMALYAAETAFGNTAVGHSALQFNVTGGSNTAVGESALKSNTSGVLSVAIGRRALEDNTAGSRNIGIGFETLAANTTASDNVAIGYHALYNNTTADSNVAIGSSALRDNIIGRSNTAVGYEALANNTNHNNTAIGAQAMYYNTTGTANTAIGSGALRHNTIGINNAVLGNNALPNNTSGENNTASGYSALPDVTTGTGNVAFGYYSGSGITTGNDNTSIGIYSGGNSANQYGSTAVGCAAETNGYDLSTALGAYSNNTSSNQVMLGSYSTESVASYAEYTELSDKRFKKNISEVTHGLDFIMQLKPVTYNYDISALMKFYAGTEQPVHLQNDILRLKWQERMRGAITRKESILYTGFLAQDVERAAQKIGYDFSGVKKPQNEQNHYGLAYSSFVVPLVKAVQEQQKMIEKLNEEVDKLKQQVKIN